MKGSLATNKITKKYDERINKVTKWVSNGSYKMVCNWGKDFEGPLLIATAVTTTQHRLTNNNLNSTQLQFEITSWRLKKWIVKNTFINELSAKAVIRQRAHICTFTSANSICLINQSERVLYLTNSHVHGLLKCLFCFFFSQTSWVANSHGTWVTIYPSWAC